MFLALWKLEWKPATSRADVLLVYRDGPALPQNRELLEVLQPLRAVGLRACERQQQEAEAHSDADLDQLECVGGVALRCRAVIGAALQGEGKMPLAQILCGLP